MAWHVQTLIMLSSLVAICGCKSTSQQDVAATTQPDSVAAHEALASYQPVASHDTDASTATASVEPNRSRRSGTANRRGSQSGQKRFPTQKMVGIEAGQIDGRHVTLSVIWPETNDRKKKPVILYLQRATRKIEVFPSTLNQMVSTGEYVGVWTNSRREDSAADSLNVSEHQLVVDWVKAHSEEYGMWPERIGLWIDEGTTTYLYALQRETGDVQASTSIPHTETSDSLYESRVPAAYEVRFFFDRHLHGKVSLAWEEETTRQGGRGGGRGRGSRGGRGL